MRTSAESEFDFGVWKEFSFPSKGDARGQLIPLEIGSEIPFEVKRVYYIFGTRPDVRRGFHAHKKLKQMAICLSGTVTFFLDNGIDTQEITLDSKNKALYLEGLVWREFYNFSSDSVLLVVASLHYDEADYVREFREFQKLSRLSSGNRHE